MILRSTLTVALFCTSAQSAFSEDVYLDLNTTVVNDICTDASREGRCYFSMKALPFDGSALIAGRTVEQIREANLNIDDYIIDGMLPRLHVIATETIDF